MATPKKAAPFQPAGDTKRVQPLGLGWKDAKEDRWVRVFDHLGKALHFSAEDTESLTAMVQTVREANGPLADKIAAELADLGLDTVSPSE